VTGRGVREREAAALYKRYQQRLSTFNAVDCDDLIRWPVPLLDPTRKPHHPFRTPRRRAVTRQVTDFSLGAASSPPTGSGNG
jgi:hypothetical protein